MYWGTPINVLHTIGLLFFLYFSFFTSHEHCLLMSIWHWSFILKITFGYIWHPFDINGRFNINVNTCHHEHVRFGHRVDDQMILNWRCGSTGYLLLNNPCLITPVLLHTVILLNVLWNRHTANCLLQCVLEVL